MVTSVVTGGAGFIGSHLCEYLLNKGERVIAIDNFGSGNKDNVKHLMKGHDFRLLGHDIIKPIRLGEKADFVYNLASRASPADFDTFAEEIILTNSAGARNAMELALKNGAAFLMASTSESYGDPKISPQPETYWGNVNPVGPRSCYDESKRFSETLTMTYVRKKGLDGRVIRIFNTYGPKMRLDDGRVVPNFMTQALAGKPMTVYGDGSQTRSFCYVSDMVRGIYLDMHASKAKGEVINIGNPTEMTVLEFAQKIKTMTGTRSKIVYKPLPVNDPTQRRPDITKAAKIIKWKPEVGLDEGLQMTIEWFTDAVKKRR